jgi:hypothetical protein
VVVASELGFVFHAAALKQVPSCEFYPMEAVRTNVLGTENVISAAIACQVKRVVVLSTDKAVYPINAMGISKAMAEKVIIARALDEGRYFHIPADNRDLNYRKFFIEDEVEIAKLNDYTSQNTERLDVAGVKKLLATIDLTEESHYD